MKNKVIKEIENLRFHVNTLLIMLDETTDSTLKMELDSEIKASNKRIRFLKDILLDLYVIEIKIAYPQVDVLREDEITRIVSEKILCSLKCKNKIKLCACVNGNRLYTI